MFPAAATHDARISRAATATPLRIVHVVRQYRPAIGGLEGVVEALAQRQRSEGHDVSVVTLDRVFSDRSRRLASFEWIDGVAVHRVPFWGSRRYPIAPGVLRHLRDASLVHVHGIDFFFDFLALTSPWHRRALVATTHGGFFHTGFAKRLKAVWFAIVTRASARRYEALVACSEQDRERFEALGQRALVAVENGVELGRFAAPPRAREQEMIYFGRLSTNKDIHGLLAWFAAVRAQAPGWRLTVAGKPDGVSVADLADRVACLDLAGYVRVIANPDDAQLAALVAGASVFVSASRYEGFGLAPVEAVAAGLMPVLRNIPPFERLVRRLGIGVLTDFATDRASVAATLAKLAMQQGREPEPAAMASFGWDVAAERYAEVYDHCLGNSVRRIGRIAVRVTDRAAVIEAVDRHVAAHSPLTIAFCNAHTVNVAEHDDRLVAALGNAMVVNDGIGVDLASRKLFGRRFPENLNGTDLTPAILEESAAPLRVFLLGAEPGVADEAAVALRLRYPRHRIVGTHHGFFSEAEEPAVLAQIRATQPDLILLGMGHPRQEIWAARYAQMLDGVTMCVGAFIDRAAGRVPRAPAWVRKARGEWLYRLAREPRRLAGRYLLGNATFMARVWRQRGNGALTLR